MKKAITLIFACLLATMSFAQETRPANVDDANIDKFVNSAFDLADKKAKYSKMTTAISDTLDKLNAGARVDTAIYNGLDRRAKTLQDNYTKLNSDLETLANEGETMVNNATKIKPVTKIGKATKNVKSAVTVIADTRKGLVPEAEKATTLRARIAKMKALK